MSVSFIGLRAREKKKNLIFQNCTDPGSEVAEMVAGKRRADDCLLSDGFNHKVYIYIYRVPQCMSPRRNWDSLNPSLPSECAPPPQNRGGGHIRLRVRGCGSPKSLHSAYSVVSTTCMSKKLSIFAISLVAILAWQVFWPRAVFVTVSNISSLAAPTFFGHWVSLFTPAGI
jgi:hypothetical protein